VNPEIMRWLAENFYLCADCGCLVALQLVDLHQTQPHVQLA